MAKADPVIVEFQADVADYNRKVDQAERLTDKKLAAIEARGRRMGEGLKRSFNLAKTAAVAFAGSLIVSKITDAIKSGLEYASSLGEVSQQLGVTTSDLQFFRYAATQVGLEQSEMDSGLQKLTKSIGEAAQGSKPAIEAFSKLGVNIRDSSGNIRSAGDLLPELADGFAKLGSDAERSALAQDLFSRSGFKLLTLLSGGAKGVNALRDAYRKLGIELSEEQIRKADDAADSLSKVKLVLESRLAGVVADNAEEIVELANALADLADKAIKVAAEWLRMTRALNSQSAQYAKADAFLARQSGLTAKQRAAAKTRAREIIDDRLGIDSSSTSYLGGLFSVRSNKPKDNTTRFAGASYDFGGNDLARALAGADPGLGSADRLATIAATMVAAEPTKALAAVKALSVELQRLEADIAEARADLSGDLREQAAARKQAIDAQLAADLESLRTDDTIKKDQKGEHETRLKMKASLDKQLVDRRLSEELEGKVADAQQAELRARLDALSRESDALSAEADIEPDRRKRRDIERQILDHQQEAERAELEAAIAAGDVRDANKARADLARKQAADAKRLTEEFLSPGQAYLKTLQDDLTNFDDRVEEIGVRGLERLNDELSESITKSLGLHGTLGDIVGDFINLAIRMAIIKPLAEALFGGDGGGSGGLGGIVGSITKLFGFGGGFGGGRASGGPVMGGRLYRVNEGASPGRVEGFIPQGSGQIIPLGQMGALRAGQSGGGVVRIVIEEAEGFASRVRAEATGVAVEVHRLMAPRTIDAAVNATITRAGRPRLG